MRIKEVHVRDFRRFVQLHIIDIPATAKLVILAGPNGNGKSSLIDAFMKYYDRIAGHGGWDETYHSRLKDDLSKPEAYQISVQFHGGDPTTPRKSFSFRSAYRNDPEFGSSRINKVGSQLDERRFARTIENDIAVSRNYERLTVQGLEDLYEKGEGSMTFGQYRAEAIGNININLKKVLPELQLLSLGNPLEETTFNFTKGAVKKFNYKNLSGGEKAAFDLILDYSVKQKAFDDTIFCIDEPEAHLNPRVQATMLEVLVDMTKDNNQLWIATHSIGMLRKARDYYHANPGTVAFLDFEVDFDVEQTLRPIVPDRNFWQRSLAIALDDLAELVAPNQIIACESATVTGQAGAGTDSEVYNAIFGAAYPEMRFISIGSKNDLKGEQFLVVQAVANLIEGTTVLRLRDRDDMSDAEIEEAKKQGIRVLRRRNLEAYMFADEIVPLLCAKAGQADKEAELLKAKEDAIQESVKNQHNPDNLKKCSGRIRVSWVKILKLQNAGDTTAAFMRDTLAPLITAETALYKELHKIIFEG
jgi:predicted ATPase